MLGKLVDLTNDLKWLEEAMYEDQERANLYKDDEAKSEFYSGRAQGIRLALARIIAAIQVEEEFQNVSFFPEVKKDDEEEF